MLKSTFNKALDAVFPQFCYACRCPNNSDSLLCVNCCARLPRVSFSCNRCGQALGHQADACGACLSNPCPQQQTIAPFLFEGVIAETIKRFKYGLNPHLAKPLAELLLQELDETFAINRHALAGNSSRSQLHVYIDPEINSWIGTPGWLTPDTPRKSALRGDLDIEKRTETAFEDVNRKEISQIRGIIPIPSERQKLKHRGFNPAALLARRLGCALNIPVHYYALQKKDKSPSQVGSSRSTRLRQAQGQFIATPSILSGITRQNQSDINAHIMVVDDVITTGATLRSAAKTLQANGVHHITAAALALSP